MLHTKKILSIIALLLIVSMGTAVPVKANTDITVYTTGNVQVIISTDGSVSLIYNGVNIQAEINSLSSQINGLGLYMSQLATRTEMNNLNQTVYQLIGELDVILEDLFGKTSYLAHVIGLNPEKSIVATNLITGAATVAGYLDSVITTLNTATVDINVLDKILSEVDVELQAFEVYVEGEFNATVLDIESLADYTEKQQNIIRSQTATLEAFMDTKVLELNQQREALREAVLTDLLTLDTSVQELASLVQDEKDRQTITEKEVQNLQDRLDEAEKNFKIFIVVAIMAAISLGCVVTISKLQNKPKIGQ